MTVDVDKRYRQATAGLHQRSIAGAAVMQRTSWDEPLVMNTALQLVWSCLEFGGSIEEVAADFAEVFEQDLEQVRLDVERAFHQLDELDLIEPVVSRGER